MVELLGSWKWTLHSLKASSEETMESRSHQKVILHFPLPLLVPELSNLTVKKYTMRQHPSWSQISGTRQLGEYSVSRKSRTATDIRPLILRG